MGTLPVVEQIRGPQKRVSGRRNPTGLTPERQNSKPGRLERPVFPRPAPAASVPDEVKEQDKGLSEPGRALL